ncbi:efflux RND transporter periplasmic adaptor subunit [Idiomarina aminovorans]|uniref:efflux RND transporter periplasmic adaptor subunit n=1 Tax=Idiomarina aminovorans TaxID=2914829 RepID=UPI002006370A|nr:efflux RND transporter periplasmic adaptor subunit [Idiomarina sp. ATCH4]MCK7459194.1 efflux RND transporter periplasmic adaptor subunit [Idiomarina sp. ATCH4]
MKFLLIVFVFALSLSGTVSQAQQFGPREALVNVEPVSFERERNRVEAVGTAEAVRSITIYPAVGDRVVAVNFQPGDEVEKDELLVELDARRQQVAVEQAQINLRDTERTVDRLQASRELGAVPQSELDNAILLRDLARVELDNAKIELEDRFIRAPFAGIIGITDVEVGDRIEQQTTIATLDDRSTLLIDFRIPEAAVSLLQEGVELKVQPWRYSGTPVMADIVELDSRINPETRMYRARAKISNENDNFLPGTSFRTSIALDGEEFASIPEAALSWGVNSPFIWVVEGKNAKRIEVQIEQRLPGRVLVSGNIQRDDLLIVEGVQSLRDGQPVTFDRTSLDSGKLGE